MYRFTYYMINTNYIVHSTTFETGTEFLKALLKIEANRKCYSIRQTTSDTGCQRT